MYLKFNQKSLWDRLKFCNLPLILYGMGNGAEKVIKQLNNKKIPFHGVMASDDFVRYQTFLGYTVKKLSDFERELDDFIILLCFGSDIPDVIDHIYEISEKHTLLVPGVALFCDDIVDDEFLEKYSDDIKEAYELLYDERSKQTFIKSLEFLYTGDPYILKEIESSKDEAYDLLDLSDNEYYLDLGAYNGDTVFEFLNHVNDYKSITAVEPNQRNFKKLVENTKGIKNINNINAGISDKKGISYISAGAGRMATLLSDKAKKTEEIKTLSVDDLFVTTQFTYIKADIEGMEDMMLSGAKKALLSKPKLSVSAYHKPGDMFTLIQRIHSLNPSYRIYLRKHKYIPLWDLNIYAK